MHLLLSPLGMMLVLLFSRLVVLRNSSPIPRRCSEFLIALCVFLMMPLGANLLVLAIERGTSEFAPCNPRSEGPLLLFSGGFSSEPENSTDFGALSQASLRRTRAAVELLNAAGPEVELIVSGRGPFAVSESELIVSFAKVLGVPDSRLRQEPVSLTTWESARELARMQPPIPTRLRLVTSALHAPRAALALRAHGFSGCREILDSSYVPVSAVPGYFIPQSSALYKSEAAMHEFVGLIAYKFFATRQSDK